MTNWWKHKTSHLAPALPSRTAASGGGARTDSLVPTERRTAARRDTGARQNQRRLNKPDAEHDVPPAVHSPGTRKLGLTSLYSIRCNHSVVAGVYVACHVLNNRQRVIVVSPPDGVIALTGSDGFRRARVAFTEQNDANAYYGLDATYLIERCNDYLSRALNDPRDCHHARFALAILHTCAKTSLTALADEATSYRENRPKRDTRAAPSSRRNPIGRWFHRQRKRLDVSVAEAAIALHMEPVALEAIEQGQREPTDADKCAMKRLVDRARGEVTVDLEEETLVLRRERHAVAKLLWHYQEEVRKRVLPGCLPLRLLGLPGGPLDAIELRLAEYSPRECKHALDMAGVDAECLRQAGDDPLKWLNGRTTWKPEQFERLVQSTAEQVRARARANSRRSSYRSRLTSMPARKPEDFLDVFKYGKGRPSDPAK